MGQGNQVCVVGHTFSSDLYILGSNVNIKTQENEDVRLIYCFLKYKVKVKKTQIPWTIFI